VLWSWTTATLTNDTIVCHPLDVLSDVDTAIPANTILMTGHTVFAEEEDQPVGKNNFEVDFTYTNALLKETVGIGGGVISNKFDIPGYNGSSVFINKKTIEAERRLEMQEDDLLLNGQKNTNTGVLLADQQVSTDSTGALRSCDGVLTLLDQYAMCDFYSDTFGIEHLDNMIDGFIAQGSPTTEVAGYIGHGLSKDVNAIMLDYSREYSGGSDLYNGMKNKLGVTPTVLNWRGTDFFFQVLTSFSNPGTVGQMANGDYVYGHPYMGMFFPDTSITVKKFGNEVNATIPNVGMGYVNYNGENRGKIFAWRKGMNGVFQSGEVSTGIDGMWYYILSAPALYGGAWNQDYLIRKQLTA
jgi:hypothetical protein